ncbi:MAG TPA: sugar phosphate isomerase/epimerase family protein [Steroidobacteraceae bacterium]|nr:sugar phosphate isomerase/epimerase family protein [Steroidobacteraceae bacterium]
MINRRTLLTNAVAAAATLAAGGRALSAATAPPTRYRHIGHTGITWGYSPDDAPNAIRDIGELGFQGFESFGNVLEAWDSRGGLMDQLRTQQLPLVAAYCPMNLTDPAQRADEVRKAIRWGVLISSYGGRVAVIGPDNVDRKGFDFAAHRADIITTLNDIGLAMTSSGITAALHPHSGSCIMTRDEIWAVMEGTNARDMKLCPDTGELLAAGVDPLMVIQHFGEQIAHVHIKDYDGGAHHDGFTPVGHGRLKLAPIMDALEALPGEFMVMAELNPDAAENKADPSTPRRAAAQSKAAFEALGYRFRSR